MRYNVVTLYKNTTYLFLVDKQIAQYLLFCSNCGLLQVYFYISLLMQELG